MKNSQLTLNFVNGAEKGKGTNMYIQDNKLYSYGPHFTLSKKIPSKITEEQIFLVNNNNYSVSTAQHKRHIIMALLRSRKQYIELIDCSEDKIEETITAHEKKIIETLDRASHSRDTRIMEVYLNLAQTISDSIHQTKYHLQGDTQSKIVNIMDWLSEQKDEKLQTIFKKIITRRI